MRQWGLGDGESAQKVLDREGRTRRDETRRTDTPDGSLFFFPFCLCSLFSPWSRTRRSGLSGVVEEGLKAVAGLSEQTP